MFLEGTGQWTSCWSVDRHRKPVWQLKKRWITCWSTYRHRRPGWQLKKRWITCWSTYRHRRPWWQLKKRWITCWSADQQLSEAAALHKGENRMKVITVDYLLVGWPTAVRSSCAPPGREWGLFCRSRGLPWWAHLWQGREPLPLKGTVLSHGIGIHFFSILKLKGTVQCPLAPENPISAVSNFFDEKWEKIFNQRSFQYFVWTPLGSGVNM